MIPRVVLRPAAENDHLEQGEYSDSKGGDALGDGVLAACEEPLAPIRALGLRHPPPTRPRSSEISVFQGPNESRVRMIRGPHGRRNNEAVFAERSDEERRH